MPQVRFVTRLYHPQFTEEGCHSCALFKNEWTPAFTLGKILSHFRGILAAPNPDNFVRADVAQVYREDRGKYEETAREWTLKYAV